MRFYALMLACMQVIMMVNTHRILGLFPHPGQSHFHVFYPIMRGLAEAGHTVTVVSYFPAKFPHPRYTDILLDGKPTSLGSIDLQADPSRSLYAIYNEFFELAAWGDDICQRALNSSAISTTLALHRTEPFDLVVTEMFNTDCMLGVIQQMYVPFVGLSSCALMPWHYDRVSLPDTPSYIPSEFIGSSDNMNFAERFVSWLTMKSLKIMYRLIQLNDNALLEKRFGRRLPDVSDIAQRVSLLFVNQHHSFSGAFPLSPQVIDIGGIHINQTTQPLPSDIQKFIDESENGVIFISWGSQIRSATLNEETAITIVRAVKRLNMRVIWKWETETLPCDASDRIMLKRWLPQKDILCHPKVKAFWSHGGQLSSNEAAYCGVPVVVTPNYGDQYLNGAAAEQREMGVVLPLQEITQESVINAFNIVLDPKYTQNAKIVSYSFRNRLTDPLVTAIWWIEHVIKSNGADLLRSNSKRLSWFAYHSYDVILCLVCLILMPVLIGLIVTIKLHNRKCVNDKKKKKSS